MWQGRAQGNRVQERYRGVGGREEEVEQETHELGGVWAVGNLGCKECGEKSAAGDWIETVEGSPQPAGWARARQTKLSPIWSKHEIQAATKHAMLGEMTWNTMTPKKVSLWNILVPFEKKPPLTAMEPSSCWLQRPQQCSVKQTKIISLTIEKS